MRPVGQPTELIRVLYSKVRKGIKMPVVNKRRCYEGKKKCFARRGEYCSILIDTYGSPGCPFCKPKVSVTNGVEYPFNRYYGTGYVPVRKNFKLYSDNL